MKQFQVLKMYCIIIIEQIQKYINLIMIQLSSSIVSSTITTCIVYPAERVKIQMHLHPEISTTKEAINKIISRSGLKGLYTGLSSQIFGNGLSYAIYFVAYAKAKKLLGFNPQSFLSVTKSSGAAGCISALLTNPFWVLKTKQAENGDSLWRALKNLINTEGFRSLWKGLLASLILVSNPIIQFGIYEILKKKVPLKDKKLSKFYDLIIFIIGAISKIIATLVTYPYTLIRTKQHVRKGDHKSIVQTLMKQVRQNGITGLFTGMKAKIIQSVLNSALMLMLYERTSIILTKLVRKENI